MKTKILELLKKRINQLETEDKSQKSLIENAEIKARINELKQVSIVIEDYIEK